MKIAIVSARKHCKTHIHALRGDGYNVHCLGASPTRIPSSYDVVVMRTSSCSHGGSSTVLSWSRSTGRPLIVHDGLSSIRRDLKALGDGLPSPTPLTYAEVRGELMGWAATLRQTHPDWSRWKAEATLQETLRTAIPTIGPDGAGMIPQVLNEFFGPLDPASPTPSIPTPSIPTPALKEQPLMRTLPTPRGPFPHDATWATLYTPPKLERAFHEASHIIEGLTANKKKFARLYLACESQGAEESDYAVLAKVFSTLSGSKKSIFAGKPLTYTVFVYLLYPENHAAKKRTFFLTYRHLTGKGMDTRIPDAVSWFLGHPEPVRSVAAAKAVTTKAAQVPPTKVPAVDTDNTKTVVGLLDAVERLEWAVGVSKKRHEATEDKIVKLRSDMLIGIDAAAAEGRFEDPRSSDPFSALEGIKERLRDLGFRGTLTLTISDEG